MAGAAVAGVAEGSTALLQVQGKTLSEFANAFDAARSSEQKLKSLLLVDMDSLTAEKPWIQTATNS